MKNTRFPKEPWLVTSYSRAVEHLHEQLHTLISEEPKPVEPKAFTLATNLFKACMNTSLNEERGLEPLKAISDSLGGWPVVKGDSWDERSSWTWIQSAKGLRKVGYRSCDIFKVFVAVDEQNPLSRIISVSQF